MTQQEWDIHPVNNVGVWRIYNSKAISELYIMMDQGELIFLQPINVKKHEDSD